jgi:hypothetical protein
MGAPEDLWLAEFRREEQTAKVGVDQEAAAVDRD